MNLGRQYEAASIEGFLAIRNSTGTYDCLPVMRYDMREESKEGVVWFSTFLDDGMTIADLTPCKFIWGRAVEVLNSCTIKTVELPIFKSVQQLREYLCACGTRRTDQVVDPIGRPSDADSRWYQWWWQDRAQWDTLRRS